MHVGIDGGCWSNRRGYGRFLRELLNAVAKNNIQHDFTVFLDSAGYADFSLGGRFRPLLVQTSESVAEAATAEGRRSVRDLLRMSIAVARESLDVFFFPSVYSYFPMLSRVPMVLGIHDTIADRNPQFAFGSARQRIFWNWKVKLAIAQADTVLTVSKYSAKCITDWFEVHPDRIRILHEAASGKFKREGGRSTGERYILYVGGISPNKNLATLIRSFSRLKARQQQGVKLMLVGDYQSDGFKGCYSELVQLVRDLELVGEVEFTGYVSDEKLCRLYNGASVFALPSLDEGFGLPAIEAMACGIPVVVSTGNALEEVVGDAGICIPPNDEDGLARNIDQLLADATLACAFSQKSLARAAEFSWKAAAERLIQILAETSRGGKG